MPASTPDMPASTRGTPASTPGTPALMGVILCGGASRRMGRDKGLLLKDGIPWARYMADKLTIVPIPVVFSINVSQIKEYTVAIPDAQFIIDSANAEGPLKGLLSVHEQFPDNDILLLACDMLDMDAATLQALINAWQDGGHEFYAWSEGPFFQPLCCIYTASGLSKFSCLSSVTSPGVTSPGVTSQGDTSATSPGVISVPSATPAAGGQRPSSLQNLLRQGKTKSLVIQNNEAFRNYNSV